MRMDSANAYVQSMTALRSLVDNAIDKNGTSIDNLEIGLDTHISTDGVRWGNVYTRFQRISDTASDITSRIDEIQSAVSNNTVPALQPVLDSSQEIDILAETAPYVIANNLGGKIYVVVPTPLIGLLGIQIGAGGWVAKNSTKIVDTTDPALLEILPTGGNAVNVQVALNDEITWQNPTSIIFIPRILNVYDNAGVLYDLSTWDSSTELYDELGMLIPPLVLQATKTKYFS